MNRLRVVYLALAAVAIVAGFSGEVFAADTGIYDDIANGYKNSAGGWSNSLNAIASRLFYLLASIDFLWAMTQQVLKNEDLQALLIVFIKKIFVFGLFLFLLQNASTLIGQVIKLFVQAGSTASGQPELTPSSVITIGLDCAFKAFETLGNYGFTDKIVYGIAVGVAMLFVIIAFAIIGAQLLVALVESYIVIGVAVLYFGFGGATWTRDIAQKMLNYAVATGTKILVLYLIVGIGAQQAQNWSNLLGPGTEYFHNVLTVTGGALLLVYLALQIPSLSSSILSGSNVLTAGGAAGAAAGALAGTVAAGAGLAAAGVGAAKSTAGMIQAAMSASTLAKEQGTSGVMRGVATMGNMASAAGTLAKDRASSSVAATTGGRMSDVLQQRTAGLQADRVASGAGGPGTAVPGTPGRGAQPPAPPPSSTPSGSGRGGSSGGGSDTSTSPAASSGESSQPAAASGGAAGAAADAVDAAAPASAAATPVPDVGSQAASVGSVADSVVTTPSDVEQAQVPGGASGAASAAPVEGAGIAAVAAVAAAATPQTDLAAAGVTAPTASVPLAAAASPAAPTEARVSGPAAPVAPPPPAAATGAAGGAPRVDPSPAIARGSASATPASAVEQRVAELEKQQADANRAPGLQDKLRDLSQVKAPQLPQDAAPLASVNIRFSEE